MELTKRVARRKHDAELKAQVIAECAAPGASVASVALAHGLNANLVHRWRRLAEGRELGRHVVRQGEEFVALPIAATAAACAPEAIRIEMRRGPTNVTVTWPSGAAAECAMWLRELFR